MRRAIVFIIAVLLLAGGLWWWLCPSHPAPVETSIYETDMVEGVVRELLAELKPPVPSVCFLAFGDGTTTPSPAFVSRFVGSSPAVRGCGSAAMPPVGNQFEISTGRPGLIIHVVEFKEITPTAFDVLIRFSNLPEGQNRFTYRVGKISGEWKIHGRKGA